MAEALVEFGMQPDLVLRAGALSPSQVDRLADLRIGLDTERDAAASIIDLPDPNGHLAERPGRLVVFDDSERFEGAAAIVVQPSMPAWEPPAGAQAGRVLAGFAYVPIASAVRTRAGAGGGDAQPPYVVACFGGSDPHDVSGRLRTALVDLPAARTIVIVGADYHGSLRPGGAEHGLDVRQDPTDFIDLLAGAMLVITSAGTLKFELAVLGRPMLMLAAADDQVHAGPAFAATGAARYVGDGRVIHPAEVRAAIESSLADPAGRHADGRRARSVIDGRGGQRIARAIGQLVGID